MAVLAPTILGSLNDNVDRTSYSVTVTTPTANAVVIVDVMNSRGSAAVEPTISGCGMSWTKGAGVPYHSIASPTRRLTSFYGSSASPTVGPITVDFGGSVQTGVAATVTQYGGINAASPLGQTVKSASSDTLGTTASVALDNLASVGNAYHAAVALNTSLATPPGVVPRTNWTQLSDIPTTSPTSQLMTQRRLAANDDASGTWTGNARWAIIAYELAESVAVVAADPVTWIIYRTRMRQWA